MRASRTPPIAVLDSVAALVLEQLHPGRDLAAHLAPDAVTVMAAGAAVLGGIVLSGSNRSTTREVEAELAEAEAARAALIGSLGLRVVSERPRLH